MSSQWGREKVKAEKRSNANQLTQRIKNAEPSPQRSMSFELFHNKKDFVILLMQNKQTNKQSFHLSLTGVTSY